MKHEIRNFELRYDGMYHITWSEGRKKHKWYLHLTISQLIRMIEIEGLTLNDILKAEYNLKPLKFKKVTLKYCIENECFNIYGYFKETLENSLINSPIIESPFGIPIKKVKNKTLLGVLGIEDITYKTERDKVVLK